MNSPLPRTTSQSGPHQKNGLRLAMVWGTKISYVLKPTSLSSTGTIRTVVPNAHRPIGHCVSVRVTQLPLCTAPDQAVGKLFCKTKRFMVCIECVRRDLQHGIQHDTWLRFPNRQKSYYISSHRKQKMTYPPSDCIQRLLIPWLAILLFLCSDRDSFASPTAHLHFCSGI